MSAMAKIVIVMIALISFAAAAYIPDGASEPNCSVYFLPICTREYEPVCGTDGLEYPSECMLCVHNMEAKENIFMRRKGPC